MTREESINTIKSECYIFNPLDFDRSTRINTALDIAIKALEKESILDKIDEIITDALDKSTDQKESQTLRWVLDKISEVM